MLKQRSVTEQDRTKLEEWIAADPDHKDRCKADFWLPAKEPDGIARIAMEDALGAALFVRAEKCLRLHIQFPPEKWRNAKSLIKFIPMIEADARKHGFSQIIWESTSDKLIQFTEQFGYRRSQNEIVKDL
jgi:hypothetical protein